jgi:acyl-CoA synthetase (AMP-forming)/AMP-acid ligase II
MQTVFDMVRLAATRTPGAVAIVDDASDRRLTFRELMTEIERFAAGLGAVGIASGSLVATVAPNRLDHAIALLALTRLGAVPALVNPRQKREEIAELIRAAGMEAAILSADAPVVTALRGALPAGAPVVTFGSQGGAIDFASCRGDAATLPPYRKPHPDAAAFIFHTSGTTGLPKGVIIPARAADGRVIFTATQGGLSHGRHNVAYGVMPLFHVVGFYAVFLATLAFNGTYHMCSAFEPSTAIAAIERHKITYLFATPTHLHALLASPEFQPDRVASVRTLMYAGAAMPPALLDRVDRAFSARIVNIYGTTEIMNAGYMLDPARRPGVVRPGFFSSLRIVRIGGAVDETVADGVEGELLVDASADATFTGYLNRPDATAEKLQDGWYRTGDVAVTLPDGDVEVRGRVDDMIISGAENVHPDEIEAALREHGSVKDVAVVGVPDERWGERIVACVVADPSTTADDLDRHCQESRLANFKRPRDYMFLEAIQRNAAGKVLRRALKAEATARLAGKGTS